MVVPAMLAWATNVSSNAEVLSSAQDVMFSRPEGNALSGIPNSLGHRLLQRKRQ